MKLNSKQVLAREAADWYQRAIIGKELSDILQSRYDRRGAMFAALLKWLGFFALAMLGLSILGFIGVMLQSAFFGGLIVLFAALGIGVNARALALDPLRRHPIVASILFTVATICVYAALILLHAALAPQPDLYSDQSSFFITALFFTSAIGFVVAYTYRLLWPLLLALLLMFHGIGAWHRYIGDGTYVIDIQDPQAMAIISAIVAAFGLFHERRLEEFELKAHAGFGHLFIVFGLLYLNVSIWILSIYPGGLDWVLVLSALSIAEIVIGARLKDSRFTGFGIVFLSINMYTRYFEEFWHRTSAGNFFFCAGLIGLLLGYLFERILRSAEQEVKAS